MTVMVCLLGLAVVLAVAAVGLSLFSAWRTQAMVLAADQRANARIEECATANEALRKALDTVAAQLRELRQQAPEPAHPGVPRCGLNLNKRSQVLRMHRQGEPLNRIAATLEVPLQEVDLLIKVHRIVIKSI